MDKPIKHIELIENYWEGKLTDEERLSFKQRLINDTELSESFLLYKTVINGLKESSAYSLKEELNNLDKELDEELNMSLSEQKDTHTSYKKKLSIKHIITIAAGFIGIILISTLLFFSKTKNEQLYSKFYEKDKGLPVTMASSKSNISSVMNMYKLGEIEQAFTLINNIEKSDTITFYKGVFSMEMNQYTDAIKYFKSIKIDSKFYEKTEFYLALLYLVVDDQEKSKVILKRITSSETHLFNKNAVQLLNEMH